MRQLYLVVHPEATHHVAGLVGGHHDSALTVRGLAAADAVAARLATAVGDDDVHLVASDLRRTRQTAEAVGRRLGIAAHLDPRLRERSYGLADGTPVGTVPTRPLPPGGDPLEHHDGVKGSETRLQVATRVFDAVADVRRDGSASTVLVTHGGAATYVVAAWIGMPLRSVGRVRFELSPGSVSVLGEDDTGDRRVRSLDDRRHLRPGRSGPGSAMTGR